MDKHIFLTDKMKENGYFVLVTMKNETDISIEFSKKSIKNWEILLKNRGKYYE